MPGHPHVLVVVHRGATQVFARLQAEFAGTLDVPKVIWDRRERDRRVIIRDVEVERRRGERRAPADATLWTARGYILARLQGDQVTQGGEAKPGSPTARRRDPRRHTGESF